MHERDGRRRGGPGGVYPPQCCCVTCSRLEGGDRPCPPLEEGEVVVARAVHPWRVRDGRVAVYRRAGSALERLELEGMAARIWRALDVPESVRSLAERLALPRSEVVEGVTELAARGILVIGRRGEEGRGA